jgi:hypothetical protein
MLTMAQWLNVPPVLLVMGMVLLPVRGQGQSSAISTGGTCGRAATLESEVPFTRDYLQDSLGFWHPLLQEVVDMPEYPFANLPAVYPYFVYERVAVQVQPFVPASGAALDYLPGLSERFVEDSGAYINDFLNALSLEQICELVNLDDRAHRPEEGLSARLFQILLFHQVWGDVQEGWKAIEPIMSVAATCPASEGKAFFFNALNMFASELGNEVSS